MQRKRCEVELNAKIQSRENAKNDVFLFWGGAPPPQVELNLTQVELNLTQVELNLAFLHHGCKENVAKLS